MSEPEQMTPSQYATKVKDTTLGVKIGEMLKTYFTAAYQNNDQKEAIIELVKRETDVILRFPNEQQRTLSYQVAGLMHSPKVTVVLCSNVNRILTNVMHLTNYRIHSESLFEQMPSREQKRTYKVFYSEELVTPFLYVTPTIAVTMRFTTLLRYLSRMQKLAYIIIDEVTYELRWTNGTRTDYPDIQNMRKTHSDIPWVLVTGPIASEAIETMKVTFNFRKYATILHTTPCFGDNLNYSVMLLNSKENMYDRIGEFIMPHLVFNDKINNSPIEKIRGLIFCENDKKCLEVSQNLMAKGVAVVPVQDSVKIHERFDMNIGILRKFYKVIAVSGVEKLAGVDIDHVQFIVHLGLPQAGLLKYFQESTVVKKNDDDDDDLECRIFVHRKEIAIHSKNAGKSNGNKTPNRHRKLRQDMIDYCVSKKCRHRIFADMFRDPIPLCINRCDNHFFEDPDENYKRQIWRQMIIMRDYTLDNLTRLFPQPTESQLKTVNDTCRMTGVLEQYEEFKDAGTDMTGLDREILEVCEKMAELCNTITNENDEVMKKKLAELGIQTQEKIDVLKGKKEKKEKKEKVEEEEDDEEEEEEEEEAEEEEEDSEEGGEEGGEEEEYSEEEEDEEEEDEEEEAVATTSTAQAEAAKKEVNSRSTQTSPRLARPPPNETAKTTT